MIDMLLSLTLNFQLEEIIVVIFGSFGIGVF